MINNKTIITVEKDIFELLSIHKASPAEGISALWICLGTAMESLIGGAMTKSEVLKAFDRTAKLIREGIEECKGKDE